MPSRNSSIICFFSNRDLILQMQSSYGHRLSLFILKSLITNFADFIDDVWRRLIHILINFQRNQQDVLSTHYSIELNVELPKAN